MISKERIHKTLICYWSAEDESFVAESSLIPHVVLGVGNTREEALLNFGDMLDDAYDEIASDNVAGYKAGRPAKGYVPFNANIRPTSKSKISDLAHEMEISQGEVLDYLAFFYECKLQECDHVPTKDELVVALNAILREQVSLSERMKQLAHEAERQKNAALRLLLAQAGQVQNVSSATFQTAGALGNFRNVMLHELASGCSAANVRPLTEHAGANS